MTYKKAESTRFVLTIVVFLIYCIMVFFLFRQFAYNEYGGRKFTYNAIEVIFGCRRDKAMGNGSLQVLGFSFMNLLPHLFIVVSLILCILKLFVPKLFNKYTDLTTTILLFLAAVLLLFTHKLSAFQGTDKKYEFLAHKDYFHLGWAAIVYSITTFVCAGLMTYGTVLAFKQDHLEDTDAIDEENERKDEIFRSKSMAELKAELMKELGKDENTDITKDADLQQATDSDLKINTINESKEDTINIKLEDKGQE